MVDSRSLVVRISPVYNIDGRRFEMENEKLEDEIKQFAKEYAEFNPNLKKVYWFPKNKEESINLIYVEDKYTTSGTPDKVDVFVVANQFSDRIRALSVGTIAPQSENKDVLPKTWGDWRTAKKIWES
jgi:hypothetical protein